MQLATTNGAAYKVVRSVKEAMNAIAETMGEELWTQWQRLHLQTGKQRLTN